eukprot:922664_1
MTENKAVYGSVQGLTRTETDPTHNRPRGFLYDKVFSVPAAVDSRLSRILPSQFTRAATDETEFIEKRRLLLQCYIQRLCKYPLLRRHDYTLKFLQVSGYN